MTLEMRDWEKREEGIEIGCEKGKNEAKAEMIMTMLSKGFSEETLLDLDFSASEIQAAKKAMA